MQARSLPPCIEGREVLSFAVPCHNCVIYNNYPQLPCPHPRPSMDIFHSNQLDNGDTIFYSIVEKQSEKGFSMNKRLLLMLENHFISYLSQPNLHFPCTHDYIAKNAKMIVPLAQINKIVDKHEDKKIIIHFWMHEKKKRIEKVWSIRFANSELLQKWLEKFEELTNRSRKATLERNGSISSRPENNENALESASKLIRRLSRQDVQTESFKNQPFNQYQMAMNQPNNRNPQEATPSYPNSNQPNAQINDSFFGNVAFVPPSSFTSPSTPSPSRLPNFQPDSLISIQNSKLKDRSIYFSNNADFSANMKKYSFKNYFRPYLDPIIKNPNNIAKTSQLNDAGNKLTKFLDYSKQCVVTLIEERLEKVKELERYKDIKLRIKEDTANWIRYNDFDDVEIQLGLIQLKNVKNENYICDGALTKMAMNNLKNLEYLYEVIGNDTSLMSTFYIPMACVINYKGYTCFVTSKTFPEDDPQSTQATDIRETSKMFDNLASASKIGFEVFQNQSFIKFTPKNSVKDKFVINYAKTYLPQLQNCLVIRKQSFCMIYPEFQSESYVYLASKKENEYQISKISMYLQEKIIELSDLMNKLEIYPLSPSEMGEILHCFGINVKYLSHIYSKITQSYIQGIIKTDAALRVFKLIFSKKLQENLGRNRRNLSEETGKELLNILLGTDEASSQLWKVVSLHSQMYFNLSIDQSEINRGYLLLGLNYYLNLEIFSNHSSIEKIFRVSAFVEAIKFHPKVKPPRILPSFLKAYEEEYDVSINDALYNKTVAAFDLEDQVIPNLIKNYKYLHSKILFILSFHINPRDNRFLHLKLYEPSVANEFEKMGNFGFFTLQRQMTEIKWQIKNQSQPQYILMLSNKLKESVQNYYGKSHPFISQIYELQSLYFLQVFEEEEAININKESLSNMIQCCGNNNRHIKISNNYYQLGECLKKCYRFDEAILNYKKAKNILEINNYQNLAEYALLLYKLGVMYLLQSRDNESYELFVHAVAIYEQSDIYIHWEALVDLYEAIHRCQVKITAMNRVAVILADLKLAEHCIAQLEKVLVVEIEFEICSDEQFVRLFKIVAEQYVNCIKRDERAMFREYILELCDYFNYVPDLQAEPTLPQSIVYFKSLITLGKFSELIQGYMGQAGQILLRLKNEKRIGRLIPSKRNDLIESYDEFMKNLVVILGEPFVLNII